MTNHSFIKPNSYQIFSRCSGGGRGRSPWSSPGIRLGIRYLHTGVYIVPANLKVFPCRIWKASWYMYNQKVIFSSQLGIIYFCCSFLIFFHPPPSLRSRKQGTNRELNTPLHAYIKKNKNIRLIQYFGWTLNNIRIWLGPFFKFIIFYALIFVTLLTSFTYWSIIIETIFLFPIGNVIFSQNP